MQSRGTFARDKAFVTCSASNAEAVERNVPNKFFPMGMSQVFGNGTGDASLTKVFGELMSARLWRALKFAENDFTMISVPDDAGFDAIEADKAKTAENSLRRDELGEGFFVSKPILQREDGGGRANERGKQISELLVRSRFQADKDEVADANFLGRAGAHGMDAKISLGTVNENAIAPDGVIIRAQEKVSLVPGVGEFSAVEATDGTATNDRDFQTTSTKKHSGRTQSAVKEEQITSPRG